MPDGTTCVKQHTTTVIGTEGLPLAPPPLEWSRRSRFPLAELHVAFLDDPEVLQASYEEFMIDFDKRFWQFQALQDLSSSRPKSSRTPPWPSL